MNFREKNVYEDIYSTIIYIYRSYMIKRVLKKFRKTVYTYLYSDTFETIKFFVERFSTHIYLHFDAKERTNIVPQK